MIEWYNSENIPEKWDRDLSFEVGYKVACVPCMKLTSAPTDSVIVTSPFRRREGW